MRGGPALALAALTLMAAGCAEPNYPTTAQPPARPQPPAAPSSASPPSADQPPQNLPILPMPDAPPTRAASRQRSAIRDSCGAAALQGLVGHPRSVIPVPLDPSRQRVACTTCPAAQDTDPGRITFLFDAGTGLIKTIRCG